MARQREDSRCCTMSSLTTQSIGIIGAPLANASHAVQLSRASQAGIQAGVQQNQNAVRATHSATNVQRRSQRSIQSEARPEGAFEEGSEDSETPSKDSTLKRQGSPKIDTVA
jgi:hypothetical protein